jgi:hypothetical protein
MSPVKCKHCGDPIGWSGERIERPCPVTIPPPEQPAVHPDRELHLARLRCALQDAELGFSGMSFHQAESLRWALAELGGLEERRWVPGRTA